MDELWMDLDESTEQIACLTYRSCLKAWNSSNVFTDFFSMSKLIKHESRKTSLAASSVDRLASNSTSKKHRRKKHATQVLSWISSITVNKKKKKKKRSQPVGIAQQDMQNVLFTLLTVAFKMLF